MSTENIDWTSAPEGATHFSPLNDEQPWRMKDDGDDGDWYGWNPDEENWVEIEDPRPDLYLAAPIGSWPGEGLPPVGIVCEMLSHGEHTEWIEVKILAHAKICGEDHAVFQYEDHVGTSDNRGACFRPIQSDEERALELVLSEIEALYAEGGPAAIYDAGYRKVQDGTA